MIAFVDTNLFKKLTHNRDGIHDQFLAGLHEAGETLDWRTTHFGLLEYLGMALRGSVPIPGIQEDWQPGRDVLEQYKAAVDGLGDEYVRHVIWVRNHAKKHYLEAAPTERIREFAEKEQQFHSDEFQAGPLSIPLFNLILNAWDADDVAEVLAVDFPHRYDGFPPEIAKQTRQIDRTAMLSEYYQERRNIILFRGFKRNWFNRPVSSTEAKVSEGTMGRLNQAMSTLKNRQDRFDHDLLGFFLLGYFDGRTYQPVRVFTQDNPNDILHRLVVFWSIVAFTWDEWSHLDGVGPWPFQWLSVFSFVNDSGDVTQNISYADLVRFLLREKIVQKRPEVSELAPSE